MKKNITGIIAALFLFIGFGMIHSGNIVRENIGSSLIGIGSIYFMVVIYRNIRKDKSQNLKGDQ